MFLPFSLSDVRMKELNLSHQKKFTFLFFFKKIYLFLAALGLCCYTRAICSCGERGLLFVAVRGLLIVVASLAALVVEHCL